MLQGQIQHTEWTMEPRVLQALWFHWEKPLIDLFATQKNHQLPLYVSPVPDTQAISVDALSISWENMYAYAFPPTGILMKVLRKLENEKNCTLILIAPNWPKQQWFPHLLELASDHPRRLLTSRRLLRQPASHIFHPNPDIFKLHAWRLSSNREEREVFQHRCRAESHEHRKVPRSLSTRANGEVFVIGVTRDMQILSKPMW